MTNFEQYILESLIAQTETLPYEEKANCLINHYRKDIDYYANVVASGLAESPAVIVDNDYSKIDLLFFYNDEKIASEKIEAVKDYFNNSDDVYFEEDDATGIKYLFSFTQPISKNFNKEDLLVKEVEEVEDFEF